MTVTTSTFATNTKQITISNELSSTDIISAIDVSIVGLGWELYDTVDVTAFSPVITKVYRAPNYDGTTYKFAILRIDKIKLSIHMTTCESWSTVTHIATNETWSGAGAFVQNYDIKNSFLIINASQRHLVLWNFIGGEPGLWTGIFEFERVAAEDTAVNNVPCWAWTSSVMIGNPWGQAANTSESQMMFAFPRTADGSTGAQAARLYAPVTNRGMFPPSYPMGTLAITGDLNELHLGSYYNISYGWDTLKTLVSPISVDAITKSMPLGRAYNVGVTKPVGGFLDTTVITADAIGSWPSAVGTSTEYLLLPMNGGCEADAAYATGKNTLFYGQSGAAILTKPIIIGSRVWLGASTGVLTYEMGSGQGGTTTVRLSNASGVHDIVFDGERSIYASTSNGVSKIDTETFTATSITSLSTGTMYLGIDNKYVYATTRTAKTLPDVYIISRTNFTVNPAPASLLTALTVASGFGTPVPDYAGAFYVATQGGTVSSQTMRMARFDADSGTNLSEAVNLRVTGASTVTPDSPTSFYIDPTSGRIYLAVGFATNGTMYEVDTALANINANTATFPTSTTGANCQSHAIPSTTANYRGDLEITPVRGVFLISPKRVGQASTAAGYSTRVQFNYPQQANPGNVASINTLATTAIGANPHGFAACKTSNSVRMIGTFYIGAADSRINVVANSHNVTSVNGQPSGRLLVKA